MYATSRAALDSTRAALSEALDRVDPAQRGAAASEAGAEIFAVVDVLDRQRSLRATLGDASIPVEARSGLVRQVFGAKIGDVSLTTLVAAVSGTWSSGADLLDSLVLLARESYLRSADESGDLETVEDELFRLGRIIAANPDLEQLLSDRTKPLAGRQDVLSGLVRGKTSTVTEALARQAIGRPEAPPADAVDAVARLAARRRDTAVAVVQSATALTDQQVERLTGSLAAIYGRTVSVHVEVDPSLLSGFVVRVGDEVIDGSGTGRLAALRRNLR